MSWLRSSPLRQTNTTRQSNNNNNNTNIPFFGNVGNSTSSGSSRNDSSISSIILQRPINTAADCDPRACYDSFCKHWQQAYDIILRSDPPHKPSSHDDVLAVVSHLDFMVTLLLVELHHCNKIQLPNVDNVNAQPPAPCLEYLLSENLLDKLYEWGCTTGRYADAVRLEQLKLYELLVSHSRHQLLCHEPFLRPLLKLLATSLNEIYPPDLEKRLVLLLNQLCVVLMQNVELLDLFFFSAAQEQHQKSSTDQQSNGSTTNFIIFSLLIPYVHREGSLGHQARDALLLCMALSQKNSNIGTYIAKYSSMCPLLVTGLGGLYSRLPNSIEITSNEWHRITPDDVSDIPELTLFMNALEFCNAVVQVAHEMIKQQLLDFIYQGFIVPVLGPALLQTNINSQISAMSYLDLIIRSVTEPELLRTFVRFLLDADKFDGERILDTLIERLLSTDTNLCMVTMALFETLLGLHCEDLMLELILKYVLSGKHVPIAYRHKINQVEPYQLAVNSFLQLTPDVMKRARELTKHKSLGETVKNGAALPPPLPSPTSTMSKTIGANWNYYGLHSGDSLYANYYAYLFDAHWRVEQCQRACKNWANSYKYQKWPLKNTQSASMHTAELVKQFMLEFGQSLLQQESYTANAAENNLGEKKQLDSLQSIGESSGYESFKWRPNDDDETTTITTTGEKVFDDSDKMMNAHALLKKETSNNYANDMRMEENWRISSKKELLLTDVDFSEDLFAQGTVNLGPFLNAIWNKLQTFTSNTLYVNLHLTGIITKISCYPLPLVHSLLLRPDILITSDTPSFHQVLRILKQQIDAELPVAEDSLEIIDIARAQLIDREFRLINSRKSNENSPLHTITRVTNSSFAQITSASEVQVMPSSSYDPFKRNDTKRKSFGRSITNMFSRKNNNNNNAASGLSQIYAFFTGVNSPTSTTNTTPRATSSLQQNAVAVTNPSNNENYVQQQQQQLQESVDTEYMHETSLSTLPNAPKSIQLTITKKNLSSNSVNVTPFSSSNSSIISKTTTSTMKSEPMMLIASGNNSEPASLESLSSMGVIANTSGTERTRDLALCAVILDEWLKELAAIAQEQCVAMMNENI